MFTTVDRTNSRHDEFLWLAAIVVTGILLRVAAILFFHHVPESDEVAYNDMAVNFLSGRGVIDNMGNRAFYNAGYSLFVLAPVFALVGKTLLGVRLANTLLGVIAIILSFFIAKEAGIGRFGRLTSAALWALYLPTGVYAVYLAKENLMVPLMMGVVWCMLRLANNSRLGISVACGVQFGMLALTGNAALSLLPVAFLAVLWAPGVTRRKVNLLISMLLSSVLIVSPWLVRNARTIGAPVLNTNGGFNLYLANNPAATGWFMSISDTPRGSSWPILRTTGEVRAADTLKQDAIDWIKANPLDFLRLAAKKAIYFWTPPLHQGKGPHSSSETVVRLLWAVEFAVISVGAIVGLLTTVVPKKEHTLMWLAILLYTGVHMVFYVIFRYRYPIMPLVAVLAAGSIESLMLKMKQPKLDSRVA